MSGQGRPPVGTSCRRLLVVDLLDRYLGVGKTLMKDGAEVFLASRLPRKLFEDDIIKLPSQTSMKLENRKTNG